MKSHLSLEPFVITNNKENKTRQPIWQMTHPTPANLLLKKQNLINSILKRKQKIEIMSTDMY